MSAVLARVFFLFSDELYDAVIAIQQTMLDPKTDVLRTVGMMRSYIVY